MLVTTKNITWGYYHNKIFHKVLNNINLKLNQQECIGIIGKSGSGKSSLLKILAGLVKDYSGNVKVRGYDISQKFQVVAYMPQKSILFKWQRVEKNLRIPLLVNKCSKVKAKYLVSQALLEFNLSHLARKYPMQISGGEQSRISLIRTLLINSEIMLLDEPFASLDSLNRREMQLILKQSMYKYKKSAVLVTHDIEEALILASRIYILGSNGQLNHDPFVIDLDIKNKDVNEIILTPKFNYYKKLILDALYSM